MTGTTQLRFASAKEVRALLFPWLACLVTMVACLMAGDPKLLGVVISVYFLGAAALGGLSIGHEYSHRTLGMLLSQPARRKHLLLVKLGVLAGMLLALGAVAAAMLFSLDGSGSNVHTHDAERLAAVVLPVLCGLFVAPWLTMLTRSPIAGTVFTMGTAGILMLLGELSGVLVHGNGTLEAEAFRIEFFSWGTLSVCAIGAVMSWRMFMRLEAIEGRGQEICLPSWLRRDTTVALAHTKRHPLWLLAKKELRLQPMPLTIAGLYLLGWVSAVSVSRLFPDVLRAFYVLTMFYVGSVSLLVGSLASAEERQLGTLEWQVLLPIATSTQWAIKVGMALGLSLLLALGLPALLTWIYPSTEFRIPVRDFLRPLFAASVMLLTGCGLYMSSVSTSGLRALLVSLPALLGAALFGRFLIEWVAPAAWPLLRVFGGSRPLIATRNGDQLMLLFASGFLVLVLRFALTNHRSADRAIGRIWRQAIWMAASLTIGVTLLTL